MAVKGCVGGDTYAKFPKMYINLRDFSLTFEKSAPFDWFLLFGFSTITVLGRVRFAGGPLSTLNPMELHGTE